MQSKDQKKWEALLAAYNRAVADAYQAVLENVENEDTLSQPGFEEQLNAHVAQSMEAWYEQSLEDNRLSGTPAALFDAMTDAEEGMAVFRLAATLCDEALPAPLIRRMAAFGTDMRDRLMSHAFSVSWASGGRDRERSDGMLQAAAALRLLGEWNDADALELVLARYVSEEQPDEMISEAFTAYCAELGVAAVPTLTEALLQAAAQERLYGPYEYVLVALTAVGQDNRSDSVFLCLRTCFRKMENKMIAAVCLGDYGDGRAVPVLKGYVDRHTNGMSRSLFYEILSSIQRLGGDISDIRDPFRRPPGRI